MGSEVAGPEHHRGPGAAARPERERGLAAAAPLRPEGEKREGGGGGGRGGGGGESEEGGLGSTFVVGPR